MGTTVRIANRRDEALAEEKDASDRLTEMGAKLRARMRTTLMVSDGAADKGDFEASNRTLMRNAAFLAQDLTRFVKAAEAHQAAERLRRAVETTITQAESGQIDLGE